MKVVIDTNVIISGIFWTGAPYEIINRWRQKQLTVICSEEVLSELLDVLLEFKMPDTQIAAWKDFIIQNSLTVSPKTKVNICADKDDNKFLEAAEAGKAKYLITGDKHLLILKEYKNTKIINSQEFNKKY